MAMNKHEDLTVETRAFSVLKVYSIPRILKGKEFNLSILTTIVLMLIGSNTETALELIRLGISISATLIGFIIAALGLAQTSAATEFGKYMRSKKKLKFLFFPLWLYSLCAGCYISISALYILLADRILNNAFHSIVRSIICFLFFFALFGSIDMVWKLVRLLIFGAEYAIIEEKKKKEKDVNET